MPSRLTLTLPQAVTHPQRNSKQQRTDQAAPCHRLLCPAQRFQSCVTPQKAVPSSEPFCGGSWAETPRSGQSRQLCEGRKRGVGHHLPGQSRVQTTARCSRARPQPGCVPRSSPGAAAGAGRVLEDCPGFCLAVSPAAPHGIAPTIVMSSAGLPLDLKIV